MIIFIVAQLFAPKELKQACDTLCVNVKTVARSLSAISRPGGWGVELAPDTVVSGFTFQRESGHRVSLHRGSGPGLSSLSITSAPSYRSSAHCTMQWTRGSVDSGVQRGLFTFRVADFAA